MNRNNDPFITLAPMEMRYAREVLFEHLSKMNVMESTSQDVGLEYADYLKAESANPGILRGLVPEHSFALSTPRTNLSVVMEASTGVKLGLLGAAIMIIFKIISIVFRNAKFNSGGSGGSAMGSAVDVKAKTEEIQTQLSTLNASVDEVNAVLNNIPANDIRVDTDTSPIPGLVQTYNSVAGGPIISTGAQASSNDPSNKELVLRKMDISSLISKLPCSVLLVKDSWDIYYNLYTQFIDWANTNNFTKTYKFLTEPKSTLFTLPDVVNQYGKDFTGGGKLNIPDLAEQLVNPGSFVNTALGLTDTPYSRKDEIKAYQLMSDEQIEKDIHSDDPEIFKRCVAVADKYDDLRDILELMSKTIPEDEQDTWPTTVIDGLTTLKNDLVRDGSITEAEGAIRLSKFREYVNAMVVGVYKRIARIVKSNADISQTLAKISRNVEECKTLIDKINSSLNTEQA